MSKNCSNLVQVGERESKRVQMFPNGSDLEKPLASKPKSSPAKISYFFLGQAEPRLDLQNLLELSQARMDFYFIAKPT